MTHCVSFVPLSFTGVYNKVLFLKLVLYSEGFLISKIKECLKIHFLNFYYLLVTLIPQLKIHFKNKELNG